MEAQGGAGAGDDRHARIRSEWPGAEGRYKWRYKVICVYLLDKRGFSDGPRRLDAGMQVGLTAVMVAR